MEQKELTNKEKITLVIKESIKFGKVSDFHYDGISAEHKQMPLINKFHTTIEDKLLLFKNLNEESHTFKTIFNTAKIALRKLQDDEQYNYYSAELILRIIKLEECFKRRLKPMGVRVIEQKEISNESIFEKEKVISNKYKSIKERDENGEEVEIFEYQKIEEPLTKNAVFLKSNITGENFSKKNKEKKEINEAIKNFSFE